MKFQIEKDGTVMALVDGQKMLCDGVSKDTGKEMWAKLIMDQAAVMSLEN